MHFDYSHHLVQLVARAEAASTRLAGADPDRRALLAVVSRRRAAASSARLDGSPLNSQTIALVDGGAVPDLDGIPDGPGGGFVRAVTLQMAESQDLAAVEYANLLAVGRVEAALSERLFADPQDVLREIHGVVARGLVHPEVIGRPRETSQAVHDGRQGMIIYTAPDPIRADEIIADLTKWLTSRSIAIHPVIVAGIAHERILQAQPFEAANGRVARAFVRVLLLALGVDPSGASVPEAEWLDDSRPYYAEVAATMRRRDDLSLWLERHTGDLARALERAADVLSPRPRPGLPDRGRALVDRLTPGATVNLRSYSVDVGVDLRTAREELWALTLAGELQEVAGGKGLTFRRAS